MMTVFLGKVDSRKRRNRLCRRADAIICDGFVHCHHDRTVSIQAGQGLGTHIFGNKTGTAVVAAHFKPYVFDFDFQSPPTGGTDLNIVYRAHNPLSNSPLLLKIDSLFQGGGIETQYFATKTSKHY